MLQKGYVVESILFWKLFKTVFALYEQNNSNGTCFPLSLLTLLEEVETIIRTIINQDNKVFKRDAVKAVQIFHSMCSPLSVCDCAHLLVT